MAGKSLVMMPWFPRDFMASTRHWSLFERAVYRELLDTQWELGSLPEDEVRLARILGLTPKEFAPLWSVVKEKFAPADGGGLINIRLEEHRAEALAQREKRVRGAQIVNAKRPAKRIAERNAKRHDERIAEHAASDAPPSPSPSPSITPVGDAAASEADSPDPVGTLETEIYRTAKSLGIPGGVVTPEVKRNGADAVWKALGATLRARPADPLPYFRGVLKPQERGFVC